MGYLANFIVYTLAMVGVMGVALFAFKKFAIGGGKLNSSKCLKVIDAMTLSPRKTLYIVSAGNEKFLIAGDVDRTTLISKLIAKDEQVSFTPSPRGRVGVGADSASSTFQETMSQLNENKSDLYHTTPALSVRGGRKTRYMDESIIGIKSSQNTPYTSVMRSLAERIKTSD